MQDRRTTCRCNPTIDDIQDWKLLKGEESADGYTVLEFTRNWTTCDSNNRDIKVLPIIFKCLHYDSNALLLFSLRHSV